MQEVYRIYVTDACYSHDGASVFQVTDESVFNAFQGQKTIDQVECPEEFELDGACEWLCSLDKETEYPFIIKGETWIWSYL